MEKNKTEEKNSEKKLTYEELEAYAQQLFGQAKGLFEENRKLKEALQNTQTQLYYADLNLAFRVLDHKDVFSKDYVNKVVTRLETILTFEDKKIPEENKEEEK